PHSSTVSLHDALPILTVRLIFLRACTFVVPRVYVLLIFFRQIKYYPSILSNFLHAVAVSSANMVSTRVKSWHIFVTTKHFIISRDRKSTRLNSSHVTS